MAVEWLLFQTSCPQSDCRHKSMELVWALVPKLPGAPTHKSYMTHLVRANGNSFFLERFEAGLSAVSGTWTNLTSIRKFCDHLLGLLECYTWILEQQLLEPKLLFEVPGQPSAIFPLVTTFLEKLALCENLQEALDSEHAASLPCMPARTSALNVCWGSWKQVKATFPDLLSSSFSTALDDFLATHPECSLERVLELNLSELDHPSESLDLSQA
ncbi:hypothetical protein MRX96_043378 [Rhipicephalus microplus]